MAANKILHAIHYSLQVQRDRKLERLCEATVKPTSVQLSNMT